MSRRERSKARNLKRVVVVKDQRTNVERNYDAIESFGYDQYQGVGKIIHNGRLYASAKPTLRGQQTN